jgi:hypothetical protein
MKKIKLIITTLVIVILSGNTKLYCQSKITTTEEEYNYVSKGYKVQIESGLDMKKGYTLKDMGEWNLKYSDVTRGFAFKGLYRENDSIPCAVMAIYQKKRSGKPTLSEYFCIPTLEAATLWDRTMSQMNENYNQSNANEIYAGMIWALMKFSSQQTFR